METLDRHQKCLKVEGLEYSYPGSDRDALQGLSFEIAPGRIVALLGPNGSGKSTTFKILSTQLRPKKGNAWVFGMSLKDSPERVRAQMGVTFQSPSLDPWLTVTENLKIQAALYGLSERQTQTRIPELLKLFRVADRAHHRVKSLSGGLARRVELAKTLLSAPRLLLLDEPTTGLDPLARYEFWTELRRLRDGGMSLLVATHLMEEADLCDDILILNKGRLVSQGEPVALKSSLGNEIVSVDLAGDAHVDEARMRECLATLGKLHFQGNHLRVETRETDRVYEVLRKALGPRIQHMSLGRPNLADVYLSVTGESL